MAQTTQMTRQNRTLTVDFQDPSTYFELINDGKAFVEFVLAFLLSIGFQLAHKTTCTGGGCLTRHSHYPYNATFFSPPFLGVYDAQDRLGDCAVGPTPQSEALFNRICMQGQHDLEE